MICKIVTGKQAEIKEVEIDKVTEGAGHTARKLRPLDASI